MTDTITLPRSVVEQALEALNASRPVDEQDNDYLEQLWSANFASRRALREALERQQVEKRIAWLPLDGRGGYTSPEPQVEQEPFTVLVRKRSWLDSQWEAAPRGFPDYGKLWADERINVYTHPQNLNCKSTQHRLATLWGYEKPQPPRQPLTDEEIRKIGVDLPEEHRFHSRMFARAIERAHGIGGEA